MILYEMHSVVLLMGQMMHIVRTGSKLSGNLGMIVGISSMIHIELLSFSSRLSPEQDPVFNVSPKTPPVVSPIGKSSHLSPRALDQLSPLFQKMEIENPPSLVAPSTTADDLLASIQRSPGTSLH